MTVEYVFVVTLEPTMGGRKLLGVAMDEDKAAALVHEHDKDVGGYALLWRQHQGVLEGYGQEGTYTIERTELIR